MGWHQYYYLIKPVNPMQILLTLKKHVHQRDIVTEIVQQDYQQSFQDISLQIQNCNTFDDWQEVYKRLVRWELDIARTGSNMTEMLAMQKEEDNTDFAKFIKKNYLRWMDDSDDRPLMSNRVMPDVIFPALNKGEKVFFIVIDNFRYDQWRILAEEIGDMFDIEKSADAVKPSCKGEFGLYLEDNWYKLNAKEHINKELVINIDLKVK